MPDNPPIDILRIATARYQAAWDKWHVLEPFCYSLLEARDDMRAVQRLIVELTEAGKG